MKRAPDHDTLAEIRAIRLAQRERGWKLIALDVEAFERAEAEARTAGRGLFAKPDPQTPADFRRRHGPCQPAAK